jgi:hypothetical protein
VIKSAISFGWRQVTPIMRFAASTGVRLARMVAPELFPQPADQAPPSERPKHEPAEPPPARPTRGLAAGERKRSPSGPPEDDRARSRGPTEDDRARPPRGPVARERKRVALRDTPPPRPRDPHHALNTPVTDPDPTEWPDPYDHREDPRNPDPSDPLPLGDVPHTPTGSISTSEPHPDQDLEGRPQKGPTRQR